MLCICQKMGQYKAVKKQEQKNVQADLFQA